MLFFGDRQHRSAAPSRTTLLGLNQADDTFGTVPRTILITADGFADQLREFALAQEAGTGRL